MKRLACITFCICLVLWSLAVNAFDSELWPGEGIPRFAAKTDSLVLHKEPSLSSPVVAKHPVEKGEEILYDQTRFRTIRPGRVTTRQSGVLLGRSLGNITYLSKERYYSQEPGWTAIPYQESDSFEYLQYRAEGSCLIRRNSEVLEIEGCPWLSGSQAHHFHVEAKPIMQWWIRVIDKHKQPVGWLLVDEKSVEFLPRMF